MNSAVIHTLTCASGTILCAQQEEEQSLGGFVIWSVILFGVLLIGMVVVSRVRKMLEPDESEGTPDGFTLHGLRELRRTGQITEEEFAQAKAAIIERARAGLEDDEEPPDSV